MPVLEELTKALIIQHIKSCTDPDLLDLVLKLLTAEFGN